MYLDYFEFDIIELGLIALGTAVTYLFMMGVTAHYCNWMGDRVCAKKNRDRSSWYLDSSKWPWDGGPWGVVVTALWPVYWTIFFLVVTPVWLGFKIPKWTLGRVKKLRLPRAWVHR